MSQKVWRGSWGAVLNQAVQWPRIRLFANTTRLPLMFLHRMLDALSDKPPVGRVGCDKAYHHADLHHKLEYRVVGLRRVNKYDLLYDRHPAKQPHFERDQ